MAPVAVAGPLVKNQHAAEPQDGHTHRGTPNEQGTSARSSIKALLRPCHYRQDFIANRSAWGLCRKVQRFLRLPLFFVEAFFFAAFLGLALAFFFGAAFLAFFALGVAAGLRAGGAAGSSSSESSSTMISSTSTTSP